MKRVKIFFAIPCGDFFEKQRKIIEDVCREIEITPIIIEDHVETKNLWKRITNGITISDYFVADISSLSANILLELGYALREKSVNNIGIFIAKSIPTPADLQGFTRQEYTSFSNFREKLVNWIEKNTTVDTEKVVNSEKQTIHYHEDFKDYENFVRFWSFSPDVKFKLTHEGLQFTNAYFPLMTNHLSLLANHKFEFSGKLINGNLGWIVKGAQIQKTVIACIMFNINDSGTLTPHVFDMDHPVLSPDNIKHPLYHVFEEERIVTKINTKKTFVVSTTVKGGNISVKINNTEFFNKNFTTDAPYKDIFNKISVQGNEIGFRCCHPEQAVINWLQVEEL